ncbi:MAG: hypothetical protein D6731_10795 [Planctomycetota bacterium]|nr:MAG: hypothetical protein D6731_10795 [Planctomycetota bacterium]
MFGASPIRRAALAATLLAAGAARADTPMEARLLEAKGEVVKLDKGSRDGVVVGQIFDLYQQARVYMLPLTNGDLPVVKSQRRVARVQVVKTEPSTSLARVIVHDTGPDGKRIPLRPKSLRALHNPTAVAPNRRPTFVDLPALSPSPWRAAVPIHLGVSNEEDDAVVYEWEVSGGSLLYARTVKPTNLWYAPAEPGEYTLNVSVRDSAGNEARTALTLSSSGAGDRAPSGFKVGRQLGGGTGFGRVADLSFDAGRRGDRYDPAGRRFFLNPRSGWGGRNEIRVTSGERLQARLKVEDHELGALASDRKALYLLDTDRKTVLRYPYAGRSRKWKDLLSKEPLEFGEPDGGTGNARFLDPVDIAVTRTGELYVLDAAQRCVQVFATKGERAVFMVSFGRPGKGALQLEAPRAMALGPDGSVYVLDDGRKTVVVYRSWRPTHEFPVGAEGEALRGIAVDPFTSDVFVLAEKSVKRFDRSGQPEITFGEGGRGGELARIERPTRLRMDPTRVLWVVDRDGDSVARFDVEGTFLGRRGGVEFSGDVRLAAGPSGELALLDRESFRVTRFDAGGWMTARFGAEGTKDHQFEDPVDVAVDAAGNLLVLDAGKKVVLEFSRSGRYLGRLGTPGEGETELTRVRDLSMVNTRRYAAVIQQRPEDNFNLLDPSSGRTVRTFGKYQGDMTPRFGCVLGVTGRLDSGAQGSSAPWYWIADDDRERLYRQRRGGKPRGIKFEFDEISDLETSVANQVFVADRGESRVVVLSRQGEPIAVLEGEELYDPWDLGVDDFGRVYVFERSQRRIVELVPRN